MASKANGATQSRPMVHQPRGSPQHQNPDRAETTGPDEPPRLPSKVNMKESAHQTQRLEEFAEARPIPSFASMRGRAGAFEAQKMDKSAIPTCFKGTHRMPVCFVKTKKAQHEEGQRGWQDSNLQSLCFADRCSIQLSYTAG